VPLRVLYSNRTESLLAAFIHTLASRDPLTPEVVVVPDRNLETWLRFNLARATGVATNLQTPFLRSFLGGLLLSSGGGVLAQGPRLLGLVLALLLDDRALAHPDLAPVRDYLRAGGRSQGADELRRFQLAEQVAHLFEEYGYSRQEMLSAWPARCCLEGTPYAETERWQRRLWLSLFGPGARRSRGPRAERLVAPTELLEAMDPARIAPPRRLHVFGASTVAPLFHRVWERLARGTELVLYVLEPCQEFWEDVADDPRDTPALRLWGRAACENVRLLGELTGCDFEPLFADPLEADRRAEGASARGPPGGGAGPTLLRRLQAEILTRAQLPPEPPAAPADHLVDGSIRLLACASVRREAEAIAQEIWRLVRADEERGSARPLRFNEIAVLVNPRDRERAFAQLSAAFAEAHGLPHNVIDLPLSSQSLTAQAARLLFDLPLSKLSRAQLLAFLTHPCALALDEEATAEERSGWVARLGIVHGQDHKDHAGSYIEGDVVNWDQGLRRLALGALLGGEASGERRALSLPDGELLPEELPRDEQRRAVRFALRVRALLADVAYARTAELTVPEWASLLALQLEEHLGAGSEAEERERAACAAAVRAIVVASPGAHRVGYRIARELAVRALEGAGGGRGQHQADGVVVSTLRPLRAIPFRVVFVTGLAEGRFPSTERPSQLDLRGAARAPGDVSPRDQDRALFLDALLSARDQLVLTWVARDQIGRASCRERVYENV
jgi:exodeoxyribonuclease V gamma subunit